jgi:hypothetical protein
MTKFCRKCQRELDVSMFSKNKSSHDGLKGNCKSCFKARSFKRLDVCRESRRILTKEEEGALRLYGFVSKQTIKGYLDAVSHPILYLGLTNKNS